MDDAEQLGAEVSAEAAAHRQAEIALQNVRLRRAAEINDTIVQRLVVANGFLELGELAQVRENVRAALDAARQIATEFMDDSWMVSAEWLTAEVSSVQIPEMLSRAEPPGPAVEERRTVLVADDAPELRTLVRRILGRGRRFVVVAEAGDGEKAVELAGEYQPDVILLDLSMPGVDGLSALPRIVLAAPDAAIGVLSSHPVGPMKGTVVAAGARGYLEKADLVHTLVPFVDEILGEEIRDDPSEPGGAERR